ncbi:cholinephosphate cytidylyltransferase A, putative [Trypanosoma equiperdum]|uniref:ethanolamine-phosphate cytidylyltransferase n=1 Tax=Trypanosoma equiperdum TaxID=5694 RepID=A0A1G4HY64_TRYEQ|nr:cholinephosphate cytidylyltransferase A, putative [Trypanosoma equiperdum]
MVSHYLSDHSFFFTPLERDRVAHADTSVETRPVSFVTLVLHSLWVFLDSTFVPDAVAPNTITLVGLMSSVQSYQILSEYYDQTPQSHTAAATGPILMSSLLCVVAIMCGALDGVHARRCRSATPLGDIFSRVCSSVLRIFFALTLMKAFNIVDISTQWYALMVLQLIEFNTVLGRISAENLRGGKAKTVVYHLTYCFRDSELSFLILCALIARVVFPDMNFYSPVYPNFLRDAFIFLVMVSFTNLLLLKMEKKHKAAIAVCLATRVVPLFNIFSFTNNNVFSLISGSLAVGLLSTEVHVSNVSGRRVHAAVICICVGSVFNDILSIGASILYVIGMMADLSYSARIPLFAPVRNVFCDGVFDLCHAGHKNFLQNALLYGNRLIVGVCGDDECEAYKRRPIMTVDERVNEVKMCKFVSQVIRNSPVTGVTEEMIKRYNIHVVVCGDEYNRPDDTYYAVPRRMGILRTAPRTEGISTSLLIARIRDATEVELSRRDNASSRSTVMEGS